MEDNPPASYGTNVVNPPVFPVASSNLSIIFEWVALLPLVIYLAGNWISHKLVGQTALAGSLPTGLFPRLGVLNMVSDFLRDESDFLDRASSVSELRRTVWDVNAGNIFPCANGAASDILTRYALREAKIVDLPENLPSGADQDSVGAETTDVSGNSFRRHQTLHILRCQFSDAYVYDGDRHKYAKPFLSITRETAIITVLIGLVVVAVLFGVFGTAAALLLVIVFRVSRVLVRVKRPSTYLRNTEHRDSGCMLVAIHENATTWYLYIGSRAIIDTLLNKPMIAGIAIRPNPVLAIIMQILGLLQLVVMTYVAAQKGWDGVGLLAIISTAWTFDFFFYSETRLAARWMKDEHVKIEASSFRFSGRVPMLGAVQLLKETSITSWMNTILAPVARREKWLAELTKLRAVGAKQNGQPGDGTKAAIGSNATDSQWVERNVRLTCTALEVIQKVLDPTKNSAAQSV